MRECVSWSLRSGRSIRPPFSGDYQKRSYTQHTWKRNTGFITKYLVRLGINVLSQERVVIKGITGCVTVIWTLCNDSLASEVDRESATCFCITSIMGIKMCGGRAGSVDARSLYRTFCDDIRVLFMLEMSMGINVAGFRWSRKCSNWIRQS